MFQLIHQNSVFDREQKLEEEVTYYGGLPVQVEDGEAIYEVDIPTDTVELWTDHYKWRLIRYVYWPGCRGGFS